MNDALVGRQRELADIERLLERASGGAGELLVVTGPQGIGKTALADAAAALARRRGFEILRASASDSASGRLLWAQLLRDIGAPEAIAAGLLEDAGPVQVDRVAKALISQGSRLILVDDVDRAGPDALEVLGAVARRAGAGGTAVIATATTALGFGRELRLEALAEEELAAALGGDVPETTGHALWVASAGLPGVARSLATEISGLGENVDPVVHLALHSVSRAEFLDVDVQLVRLLEVALERTSEDATRARLLARLSRELLGDAPAGARRRSLADEALALARRSGDRQALVEVLDARLHALWDPVGAEDRLAAADEILGLARTTGDAQRERQATFWRFIALMELARVDEAESALAAYARSAAAAGDALAMFMVTARQAMLAILRGRFDEGARLTDEVSAMGQRAAVPDTERLVGTLRGSIAVHRDLSKSSHAVEVFRSLSIRMPGHLYEATAARILLLMGRTGEASMELQRILPRALASSGPRWVGAIADLAAVAAGTHNMDAAERLYQALAPFQGRLVVFGGANSVTGPVDYYLGLLATEIRDLERAVVHFEAAIALCERIGAVPLVAFSLDGLSDALTARGITGDLDRASQSRRRARSIAEQLGMTVMLDRLSPPADEWTLLREGGGWILQAGAETARLPDSRGLHYLRALVAAPRRDIRALDLAAGGAGLVASSADPVLDDAALANYRRRLDELKAELEAAERAGDTPRAERVDAEQKALLEELRKARSLGGRVRDASPEAERARVNVTRTLRATIDRIAAAAPRAAAHFRVSIHTGRDCRYEPASGGPNGWHV
jgi:tetratricopeptide (TPR) repeat protein